MQPENAVPRRPSDRDNGTSDPGSESEFNEWLALQKATDQNRANIIADIVGHPTMASVEELDYMSPDLSEHSIRRHLKTLEEAGVVVEHELETRHRDFPYKFYTISDDARELFDRNGLFPVEAWQRQYASVKKTARIRDVEAMPRPDNYSVD